MPFFNLPNMNRVNSVQYQISLKDLLSNALNRATANVNTFEQQVNNATADVNRLNAAMSGMGGTSFLKSTGAVALGTMLTDGIKMAGQEAVNQVKSILSAGLDVSKLKAEFGVLAGKETGEALFGDLNKWIGESVFGTEQFANAKLLLSYGINARQIMPDLKMLGDVAMGDAEKMKSLALVFGQTTAAGKLMGGDLNQYIQAGFNPLMEMSRTTGKSFAQLKEEMSDGAISADMVHKAFISATSSGGLFHNMLKDIGDTPFGKLQAMQGNIDMAKAQLGEALLPAMSGFMDAMKPLIDKLPTMLSQLKPTIESAIKGFTDLAGWLSKNGEMLFHVTKNVIELGAAIWGFSKLKNVLTGFALAFGALQTSTLRAAAAAGTETTAIAAQETAIISLTAAIERLNFVQNASSASFIANAEGMMVANTAANRYAISAAAAATTSSVASGEAAAAGAATAGLGGVSILGGALLVTLAAASIIALTNAMADKNENIGKSLHGGAMYDAEFQTGLSGHFEKDTLGYDLVQMYKGIKDTVGYMDTLYRTKNNFVKDTADYSSFGKMSKEQQDLLIGMIPGNKQEKTAKTKNNVASAKLQEDISKVTGQQVKNIYVTINGGLVHEFTVKTTNLTESKPEIKRLVTEVLTDAINDSQLNN